MYPQMLCGFALRIEWCSEYQPNLALLKDIGGPVPLTGLEACIGQVLKTKSGLVIMRCLLGIAYIQLYIVSTMYRQKILRLVKYFLFGIREILYGSEIGKHNVCSGFILFTKINLYSFRKADIAHISAQN
jgi:hypothetical protein